MSRDRSRLTCGLARFAGKGFATAIEGWVIAADSGFETLHDSGMTFRASQQVCETHARGFVRRDAFLEGFKEILDCDPAMGGVGMEAMVVNTGA